MESELFATAPEDHEVGRMIGERNSVGLEDEMADIYAYGIHDYANKKYQKGSDYPEEWFDETEKVDEWIRDHEGYIYKWMYDLIFQHKSDVLKIGENRVILG